MVWFLMKQINHINLVIKKLGQEASHLKRIIVLIQLKLRHILI